MPDAMKPHIFPYMERNPYVPGEFRVVAIDVVNDGHRYTFTGGIDKARVFWQSMLMQTRLLGWTDVTRKGLRND